MGKAKTLPLLVALVAMVAGGWFLWSTSSRSASAEPAILKKGQVWQCFNIFLELEEVEKWVSTNNFGNDHVTATLPTWLCEEAVKADSEDELDKAPRNPNIYECFEIESDNNPNRQVSLETRNFGEDLVDVRTAGMLCEGAGKGDSVREAEKARPGKPEIYECFWLEDANDQNADKWLATKNFGIDAVKVRQGEWLCEQAGKGDTEEQAEKNRPRGRIYWPKVYECFWLDDGNDPPGTKWLSTWNFGTHKVKVLDSEVMCEAVKKTEAETSIEVDSFPNAFGEIVISEIIGGVDGAELEPVPVGGPTTVVARIQPVQDGDGDGKEEIQTEIVEMELAGAGITVRLRDPSMTPFQPSTGEIEETENIEPGRLDLPPLAPSGTADSFFDVYVEVVLPDLNQDGGADAVAGSSIGFERILHNEEPLRLTAMISEKPAAPGETYCSLGSVPLFEDGIIIDSRAAVVPPPTAELISFCLTPIPDAPVPTDTGP